MAAREIRKISVIGLGAMGTPISTLLMKAGYKVTGFDIAKKQIAGLARLGLKPARSVKEAARGADLTLLSLPNWNAVKEAVEGKDGLLSGVRRGQIGRKYRALVLQSSCKHTYLARGAHS